MSNLKAVNSNQPKVNSGVVRLRPEVKAKAIALLAEVKQGGGAKRFNIGDLIEYLVVHATDHQKSQMRAQTVSHEERFFAAFETARSTRPELSKDEYFALVMDGKVNFESANAAPNRKSRRTRDR